MVYPCVYISLDMQGVDIQGVDISVDMHGVGNVRSPVRHVAAGTRRQARRHHCTGSSSSSSSLARVRTLGHWDTACCHSHHRGKKRETQDNWRLHFGGMRGIVLCGASSVFV